MRAFSLAALLAVSASAQAPDTATLEARLADGDPAVRLNAADALGQRRSRGSAAKLAALAGSDPVSAVRQSAAGALGFIGDAAAVPALIGALKDSAAPVRFAAVRSLGSLRAAAAVGPLSALLKDPDVSMRRTAAAALHQIGDPGAAPALKAALGDADEGVRLEAAGALARLGDGAGTAAALDGLKSKDASSRRRAAVAASLSGDASALAALDAASAAEKDKGVKARIDEARTLLRERLDVKKVPAPAGKQEAGRP